MLRINTHTSRVNIVQPEIYKIKDTPDCKDDLDSKDGSEWEKAATETGEMRNIAVQRMKACVHENSDSLNLKGLGLSCLPENLPPSIKTLEVSDNFLTRLPESLPSSLTSLLVRNNRLNELPESLPGSLILLDTSNNSLTLTALPKNMRSGSIWTNRETKADISNKSVTRKKRDIAAEEKKEDVNLEEDYTNTVSEINAYVKLRNSVISHYPNLILMAKDFMKNNIKSLTGQDVYPDTTYIHLFEGGMSSSTAYCGLERNIKPLSSMTLTELAFKKFDDADSQRDNDTLNVDYGVYKDGPGKEHYNTENEVRILPSDLRKILKGNDFDNQVKDKIDEFWKQYEKDVIALNKTSFVANARKAKFDQILSEEEYAFVMKNALTDIPLTGPVSLLQLKDNSHSQGNVQGLDINGYSSSDILRFVKKDGGVILYIPGAEKPFTLFASDAVMRQWIKEQGKTADTLSGFSMHFSLYNRQDGTFKTGVDNGIKKLAPGEWDILGTGINANKNIFSNADIFSQIVQRTKERMFSDADIMTKSNAEVSWDRRLHDMRLFNQIFGPIMPLIGAAGGVLATGGLLAQEGLQIRQAVSGDTQAEREEGILSTGIDAGMFLLFAGVSKIESKFYNLNDEFFDAHQNQMKTELSELSDNNALSDFIRINRGKRKYFTGHVKGINKDILIVTVAQDSSGRDIWMRYDPVTRQSYGIPYYRARDGMLQHAGKTFQETLYNFGHMAGHGAARASWEKDIISIEGMSEDERQFLLAFEGSLRRAEFSTRDITDIARMQQDSRNYVIEYFSLLREARFNQEQIIYIADMPEASRVYLIEQQEQLQRRGYIPGEIIELARRPQEAQERLHRDSPLQQRPESPQPGPSGLQQPGGNAEPDLSHAVRQPEAGGALFSTENDSAMSRGKGLSDEAVNREDLVVINGIQYHLTVDPENHASSVKVQNQEGNTVSMPVYQELLTKSWHMKMKGGQPVFNKAQCDLIENTMIINPERYECISRKNSNETFYGNSDIVGVYDKAPDLISAGSDKRFNAIELNGSLVPIKENVIGRYGMKYNIEFNKKNYPVAWDGQRWIFEPDTSSYISDSLKRILNSSMCITEVDSTLVSATSPESPFNLDSNGDNYVKYKNGYFELVDNKNNYH